MTTDRRCRTCEAFTPSGRPLVWGECGSVAAKHGLYRPVVAPLAVRAGFGCVHWTAPGSAVGARTATKGPGTGGGGPAGPEGTERPQNGPGGDIPIPQACRTAAASREGFLRSSLTTTVPDPPARPGRASP